MFVTTFLSLDGVMEAPGGEEGYEHTGNSNLISGDVVEEIGKLKESDLGTIQVPGSRTLVQTLIEADLIDEYRLMTFPVILGAMGKRLFDTTSPASSS